ncbi:hypothetical protein PENSPDRAFT_104744 [Peniophora sp. CONT]|nr:hypothetical protein PENSPDRAFT_104744 [Peniophora sp. CONT]
MSSRDMTGRGGRRCESSVDALNQEQVGDHIELLRCPWDQTRAGLDDHLENGPCLRSSSGGLKNLHKTMRVHNIFLEVIYENIVALKSPRRLLTSNGNAIGAHERVQYCRVKMHESAMLVVRVRLHVAHFRARSTALSLHDDRHGLEKLCQHH